MNLAEQFLLFLSSDTSDDQHSIEVKRFIPLVRRILHRHEFRIVIMDDGSLAIDNEGKLNLIACSNALELGELLFGHPHIKEILADLDAPPSENDFPLVFFDPIAPSDATCGNKHCH